MPVPRRSRSLCHATIFGLPAVLGTLVVVAMPGCAKNKPQLGQASDQVDAGVTPVEHTQTSSPSIPSTTTISPDVPIQLWVDLHWLPAEIVGINGTPPGTTPIVAQWVFSQPFADHEACRALERGLAEGYGIEWEQPPQSFVLFGSATLEEVEDCARAFMQGMGGSARMDGQTLHLQMDGSDYRIQLAHRGEQLVAVVDDGRLGAVDEFRADRLLDNEPLTRLLTRVDTSAMQWVVSTRDLTQATLGVPSRGYVLYTDVAGGLMQFYFAFESESEARRAVSATDPFIRETEAFLGVSLHAEVKQQGDTLAALVKLSELATLEPAKLEALEQKVEALTIDGVSP